MRQNHSNSLLNTYLWAPPPAFLAQQFQGKAPAFAWLTGCQAHHPSRDHTENYCSKSKSMLKHKLPKKRGTVCNLPDTLPTTSIGWVLHSSLYVMGRINAKASREVRNNLNPFSVLITAKLGRKKA